MEIAHASTHGIDEQDFKNYMIDKNYSIYIEEDYEPQDIWFFDNLV